MNELTRDNYKKIAVEVEHEADARFTLDGVTHVERKDGIVSFYFKGDINVILKILADLHIRNLWVEEPSLEEIFLHYYEKEG